MKIVIERSSFANALAKVKDTTGNSTLPITENVKIETVGDETIRLTATNLETTISTTARCQVREQGAVTLPIKRLVPMVNVLTAGIVELSCDDRTNDKAKLVGGDSKYSIATLPVAEFPIPDKVEGEGIKIGQKALRDLLSRSSYATSTDTARRTFMGVNLSVRDRKIFAIGADGIRFAIASAPFDGGTNFNIILPSQPIRCLRACLENDGDVVVRIKDMSTAVFETESWTIQTKLIAEQYPDVLARLPRVVGQEVSMDRAEFEGAVRQASVTSASVGLNCVSLTFKAGVLRLVSTDKEVSDSEIIMPIKYDGEECTFRLNPKYILDALSQMTDDTILFRFVNVARPVELTVDDDSYYAQVMGLRA